mgnify:FL=1
MNCRLCNDKLLPYGQNLKRIFDVGNTYVMTTCSNCCDKETEKLKQERFVEEYKGENIYFKDGLYFPYWEAPYTFDDIEGAKERIDNKNIAVVDMRIFGLLKR